MKLRNVGLLIVGALTLSPSWAGAGSDGDPPSSGKKVLVELYTSQGCDSCPAAADLVGRLKALGYGPDKVVTVAFHVDYFNDPWVDPFSSPEFSRRQMSYNSVQKRDDLYFTPMMMVDGRFPMLGSDQPKALAALARALKEPPGVELKLSLDRSGEATTLSVDVSSLTPATSGRELLVGVAVTEDPVSTAVASGENGGKTLVEHHAVRSFAHEMVKTPRSGPKTVTFPLKAAPDWNVERCRVAVFAQDRTNGKVYQAASLPWTTKVRAR